jgi:hypothetical protein
VSWLLPTNAPDLGEGSNIGDVLRATGAALQLG